MYLVGVEMVLHPERNMSKHNYDIGLLKLDRWVSFDRDIGPICLDGFVETQQDEYKDGGEEENEEVDEEEEKEKEVKRDEKYPTAFISGFGLTLYRDSNVSAEPDCTTNHFLPRPFHPCARFTVLTRTVLHKCAAAPATAPPRPAAPSSPRCSISVTG